MIHTSSVHRHSFKQCYINLYFGGNYSDLFIDKDFILAHAACMICCGKHMLELRTSNKVMRNMPKPMRLKQLCEHSPVLWNSDGEMEPSSPGQILTWLIDRIFTEI